MVVTAVVAGVRIGWDPSCVFLRDRDGAAWIRAPREGQLMAVPRATVTAVFQRGFALERVPERATLRLQGLRSLSVELNGTPLGSTPGEDWKTPLEIELAPHLRVGTNQLRVHVTRDDGPPMLWASAPELGLATGTSWQTRVGGPWSTVALARHPPGAALGQRFEPAGRVFLAHLPLLLATLALAALGVQLGRRTRSAPLRRLLVPSPAALRWMLMAALAVLGLNNLTKLPLAVGMDSAFHTDAIREMLESRRLLDPRGGIQHFQAPLYYGVAALQGAVARLVWEGDAWERALRGVPLLLGLLQLELCYRALRLAFRGRPDLQRLGLLFGAVLPVNLTMNQVVGNEPMVAVTGGASLVIALHLLDRPSEASLRSFVGLGAVYGMALLSKVSALVLLPALAVAVALHGWRERLPAARTALHGLAVFGTTGLVAGWFFVRGRLLTGRWLFSSSQDPLLGFDYWQDPGYRMLGQYLRFGEALQHPFFSAMTSFWDGLYASLWSDGFLGAIPVFELAPPWNYGPMLAGLWLALLPSAALLGGLVRVLWPGGPEPSTEESGARLARAFCGLCALLYLLAIWLTHLGLPIYSAAKASYAMAIVPALCVLVAAGLEPLLRRELSAALVSGGMITWAGTAYLAFFVR